MIKFHPDPEQLSLYVQGGLTPVESLMVRAHCDYCDRCSKVVHEKTVLLGEKFASENVLAAETRAVHTSTNLSAIFDEIVKLPASNAVPPPKKMSTTVELDGRRFVLPRTLRKFISSVGNWSSLVGKVWQAPVKLGGAQIANLVYIGQHGEIPEHTHKGVETTLVLKGEFKDGINAYQPGDYIRMNGTDTHTPYTDSPQGCLIFSVLDQPLQFTCGIAKFINPFSAVYFR